MPAPAVTYTFSNGTTSDATQVNTNFTNVINAMTDGTADFAIGTLTVAGAVTFNGAVTLGNASADDITITGSLASSITVKTNSTYNFGSSTSGLLSVYLGNGANKTTRIMAGTVGTSWTFTLPNDVPTITGQTFVFNTSGTAEFRYPDKFTASKTSDYTATGDETVILCDASSASFTVTLPAASTMTGKELTIIKTNSGLDKTVTIDANSTEIIIPSVQSGQLTYILYTQYEAVTIKCNGTSWYVISHQCDTTWVNSGVVTIGGTTTAPTKGNSQTTDVTWWRRLGDSAHIRQYYVQSSSVGSAAGSGDYLFTMPTNMTIDTNKCTVYATVEGFPGAFARAYPVGTAQAGTGSNSMVGNVVPYDSTNVRILGLTVTDNGTPASAGGLGMNSSSTIYFVLDYIVPISGWNP